MKMNHIYFLRYTLFLVLFSNILFTTFDFHQEDFNQKKHIELKQKEFLKRYQKLKKELLESFKVHQDNPELKQEKEFEEEKTCKKLQPSMKDKEEKKDVHQYFFKADQNKPFILITLKPNDNKPIQSRFAVEATILGIGKAIVGWLGLGGAAASTGAATAAAATATAAATEAAIVAGVTKTGAIVGGTILAGTMIKDQFNKNPNNNIESKVENKNYSSEAQKNQALTEQVHKFNQITSLEKTNPAQAEKEKEALRALFSHAKTEEKKNKLLENNFSDLNNNPNLQRTLIDAGLIKNTSPGYNSPPEYLTNPTKTAAPKTTTSTEGKIPAAAATSTTIQIPTTQQASNSTQALTQEKVTVRSIPITAINDTNSTPLNHYAAIQAFMPRQITTPVASTNNNQNITDTDDDILPNPLLKKKHQADSILKQHIKNNTSSESPTPPPPDNDPDDEKKIKTENPNGIYKESPKHHQNSQGSTSKAPNNGQKALNESIGVQNGKWRIAIEGDKFVVFEKTSEGVYHGYVIENPGTLHQDIKNALYRNGWVQAINNLKFIKK